MVEQMKPAEHQFWSDVAEAVVKASRAGLTDREITIALTAMLGRLIGGAYSDEAGLDRGLELVAAALRLEAKARLNEQLAQGRPINP